ncbi:hypothetical protein BJ138DRAFT_1162539 [Hygrophoropsis aurantiaca]|uniref:Uncharacterized protein n=1 Tax=Hygrophoropsis aurantiaca TaxID=72124 RepID=A0ACB7ZZK6_9AGAM|nr:hypothetical protein BJ138DRAFT_1162539 [Hygrophoropsis aurantiaca]
MASMAEAPVYMLPGAPVLQPPHLEGLSDPSLSTEILPGPPSLLSIQQAGHKRDPRKPGAYVSYLPASDPGSTYSGLMAASLSGSDADGPRRKRARVDKGTAASRAQRASARSMNTNTAPPLDAVITGEPRRQPSLSPIPDSDPVPMPLDSDSISISRANSVPGIEDGTLSSGQGRSRSVRKDKGKAKETDKTQMKIKEEPNATYSFSPEPTIGGMNEDHCSSCRSLGALVYCDGCPRAFHLWCLDPPMEAVDLPDGERWFCPSCFIRKNPPSKPPPSFMSPLIQVAQTNYPREFQLPEDVRNFFKDVATGPNGTYVDSSEIKPPRLNRHGQIEDRDPYRLKDRNGVPVLCFRCGTSALNSGVITPTIGMAHTSRSASVVPSAIPEIWRSIVACDYCNLHWHLDCLDPPLTSMPPFGKKWMCPSHADHVLPKRRIAKQGTPIDITKPKQMNNGNIDVIHPQAASAAEKLSLDEVLINGRRYRVPERIIMLDFWSKISKDRHPDRRDRELYSTMSSPLTSLSSLDGKDEDMHMTALPPPITGLDVQAAQVLCGLRDIIRSEAEASGTLIKTSRRNMADISVQTDIEEHHVDPPSKPNMEAPKPSTAKRKAPYRGAQNAHASSSSHSNFNESAPIESFPAKSKRAKLSVKHEPLDGLPSEIPDQTKVSPSKTRGSKRTTRHRRKANPQSRGPTSGTPTAPPAEIIIQDSPVNPTTVHTVTATSTLPHMAPAAIPLPAATIGPTAPHTPKASVTITQPTGSGTPSLKIRLPRLSAVSAASNSASVTAAKSAQLPSPSSGPGTSTSDDSRPRRSSRRQDSIPLSLSAVSSFTTDGGDGTDVTKPKYKSRLSSRKFLD